MADNGRIRTPNRTLGGVHGRFWELCEKEELHLQKCDGCQEFQWPPAAKCEKCGHDALQWTKTSGRGELISWCTFVQKYYEALDVPYDTILVGLEEGPLFISNPEGFSNDVAEVGTSVEVGFVNCEDEAGPFKLPVFHLAT